jgi:hypothetical protein
MAIRHGALVPLLLVLGLVCVAGAAEPEVPVAAAGGPADVEPTPATEAEAPDLDYYRALYPTLSQVRGVGNLQLESLLRPQRQEFPVDLTRLPGVKATARTEAPPMGAQGPGTSIEAAFAEVGVGPTFYRELERSGCAAP